MTQPDESVSAEFAQQTSKAGKPRQRIKWDDEMNTFIMRSYYIDTENETNMAMYRQKFTKHLSHSTLIYVLQNKELPINDVQL
jgi:hypothetical protein